MLTGTVVRINSMKQFGFIKVENNPDFFFHRDDFQGHWNDLEQDFNNHPTSIMVEFESIESPKGPRAKDVKRIQFPNEG